MITTNNIYNFKKSFTIDFILYKIIKKKKILSE